MRKRPRVASLFSLAASGAQLALDAQQVIMLRLAKLARGGPRAQAEATRMVAEKVRALGESQTLVIKAVATGKGHTAPEKVLGHYSRKVGANKRRLGKGG